jgi:hypothetical protein
MPRILLILLILANLAYWAWHRPAVVAWHSPNEQNTGREPARLQAQIHPEALTLLTPVEVKNLHAAEQKALAAAPASSAPSAPASTSAEASDPTSASDALVCLQSPALGEDDFTQLTQHLQQAGFSRTDWVDLRREFPGRWGIYMGRFEDKERMQRKADALHRLKVDFEEIKTPAELSPGLLLGHFSAEDEAHKQLGELGKRGVRSAKVVVLKPASVEHRLRIDALTAPQARKVRSASTELRWRTCPE